MFSQTTSPPTIVLVLCLRQVKPLHWSSPFSKWLKYLEPLILRSVQLRVVKKEELCSTALSLWPLSCSTSILILRGPLPQASAPLPRAMAAGLKEDDYRRRVYCHPPFNLHSAILLKLYYVHVHWSIIPVVTTLEIPINYRKEPNTTTCNNFPARNSPR